MPRRRFKRVVLGVVLSAVLIGAGGLYTAWRLSWQQPTWYAPPNQTDARIITLADDAEYALLEQTQKVRADNESWSLRLSEAQINAWLSARLPRWIEHDANLRWPEQIGTPQVLIDAGGIRVAVPVAMGGAASSGVSRTIVATLQPAITHDGRLSLKMSSLALGKVWVPGEPLTRLVDAVREVAPEFIGNPKVQQAIDVLAGRATLPPELDLPDGRHVRVKDVRLERGVIAIAAQTHASADVEDLVP